MNESKLATLNRYAIDAATRAGEFIASRSCTTVAVERKSGGDTYAAQVVTEVDRISESIIMEVLKPACERYGIALLSEEQVDDGSRLHQDYFWCIDPMDGTLSFIEFTPGYSVSIALLTRSGEPLIGVVYDPVTRTLYSARKGCGVTRNGHVWYPVADEQASLTLACDRSLVAAEDYPRVVACFETVAEQLNLSGLQLLHHGGAVMNACWILENHPGCYFKRPKPRQGGGSVWDFAATACIFRESGAIAADYFAAPLQLNPVETVFMNQRGVLYATDPALVKAIRSLSQAGC